MAINLGDINFGLGADTKRLEAARKSILEFGQAVNRAAASQADGARQVEAALRRQEKAILSALQSTLKMNESIRQTGAGSRHIQTTTNSFNRLVKELTNGQKSALEFQRALEDFQASSGRVNRTVAQHRAELSATAKAQRDLAKAESIAAAEQAKAARIAFDAARAQQQSIIRTERAYANATITVEKFVAAVNRTKGAPSSLSAGAQDALARFQTSYSSAGGSTIQQSRAANQFRASIANLNNELAKIRGINADSSIRRLADVFILLEGPLSGVATRLALISSLTDRVNLATAAAVVGVSAGAFAFAQLGRNAITAGKNLQRIEQGLIAVQGSATLASVDINYLSGVADRSGAVFTDLARYYVRLTAASKGTNLEGELTRKIFENILFASQKLGQSNEDLGGTFRAIEQIISKGKVQAEELRGQLGDRLPGAVQVMAQALGVSTQELDKLLKKGKVTSDSLVVFSETLAQRLGVDVSKAIDTVVSDENRLFNAFNRFNLAIDDAIGFSAAYQNSLNLIAQGFDFLTNNLDTLLLTFGTLAGGIVGAIASIYAPTIIAGFTTLVAAVRSVTVALVAMNAAVLANPLGAIASILARVAAVAAGAAGGFYLLSQAVGGTGQAHFDALPGVKAYITAQENLKKGISATTQEYIKQQEVFLQGVRNRINELNSSIQFEKEQYFSDAAPGIPRFAGNLVAQNEILRDSAVRLKEYGTELEGLLQKERDGANDLQKLNDILKKQTEDSAKTQKEIDPFGGAGTGSEKVDRVALALKNARDTIRETDQAYDNLFLSPRQREFANIQLEVNKSVENFRDSLTRAKIPAEQVTELTNRYAESLKKLKEGEYNLRNTVDAWETVGGVLQQGLSGALDSFVDKLFDGQLALSDFLDLGKQVVADLIKTFAQLALINPLINGLFGTAFPTVSFGGGRAEGGPLEPGKWYIAGERGPEPIWGGGAGAFALGYGEDVNDNLPSTFRPSSGGGSVGGSGGMGGTMAPVFINIQTQPGEEVEQQERQDSNGAKFEDIIIKTVNSAALNGQLDNGVGAAFGVKRKVSRR